MRRNGQKQFGGLTRRAIAFRGVARVACALVIVFASGRQVVAQSSKMHAAFDDAESDIPRAKEPIPGTIQLVSSEQAPAAKPVKPPTPPPARKSPAVKKTSPPITAEMQSPAEMEELPPAPLKAVLP